MRSIPWAILSVMGFAVTCLIALSSGNREIEACSTTPEEWIGSVEQKLSKLVRPRESVGVASGSGGDRQAGTPREPAGDRVRRLVSSLARDLAAGRYSPPSWTTRLRATARDLSSDEADELVALSHTPELTTAELAASGELLRLLRNDSRRYDRRPSAATVEAARHALGVHEQGHSLPLDVAARTLAAWGDSVDHALLFSMARGAGPALRGTLFTALGHSVAAEVALHLAEEPAPEAMIGLRLLAEHGSWAVGDVDRARIVRELEARVGDAQASETLRNRALDALFPWSVDGSGATLVAVALAPDAPESLARNAAARLARTTDQHEALEQALRKDGPRGLLLAEALAADAGRTTDAGLRGVVLEVLSRATDEDQAPERRRRALHALGRMHDPVALNTVALTLSTDPDPAVRAAAVVALREFPRADVESLLDGALRDDPSETLRRLARHELGRRTRVE